MAGESTRSRDVARRDRDREHRGIGFANFDQSPYRGTTHK